MACLRTAGEDDCTEAMSESVIKFRSEVFHGDLDRTARQSSCHRRRFAHRHSAATATGRAQGRLGAARLLRCVAADTRAERSAAEARPVGRERRAVEDLQASLPRRDEGLRQVAVARHTRGALAPRLVRRGLLLRKRSALPSLGVTRAVRATRRQNHGMTTMLKTLSGSIALFLFTVLAGVAHAVEQLPTTARKIVLEKAETGYRWKLVTAPVPQPGDRQVLVRVHAVGLNRGDWEVLGSNNSSGALVGRIPGSDAAGEVVAVGKNVKGFRPGARVTSLYFRNWTDGTASKEILNAAHGFDVDGVLGEYVVLEDTAIVAAPKSLAYEEAATLPTAGLTAWNATV